MHFLWYLCDHIDSEVFSNKLRVRSMVVVIIPITMEWAGGQIIMILSLEYIDKHTQRILKRSDIPSICLHLLLLSTVWYQIYIHINSRLCYDILHDNCLYQLVLEQWLHCSHLSTHWGRMTLICVGNLTIIGPDNGLSPGRRQAIIWTNAWILVIGPWGTNLSEILFGIHTFSLKKIHLKMSSAKWRPFCLGLNVLIF